MATIPSPPFPLTPLFMQAVPGDAEINYDGSDFGELLTSIWLRPGIITPTSFRVDQADSVGWAIKVRAGIALVGSYLVINHDATTIDVSALNTAPIGTRTHRVFLVVSDRLAGDDEYTARIKVVEDFGSGAATPDAAATMLLATFTISPGQSNILTANISAKPRNAAGVGDFIPFNTGGIYASGLVDTDDSQGVGVRACYGNGRVWLSGSCKRTSGGFTATTYDIGQLPWYLRPMYDQRLTGATSSYGQFRLNVGADGAMTAVIADTDNPNYLFFDGISYEVD